MPLIDYLSLLAIVIIGIPHGALDLDLAVAGNSASRQRLSKIFLIYVAIAVLSFITWHLIPTTALVTFLLLSTIHFGRANPLLINYKNKSSLDALSSSIVFQGGLTTIFLPYLYWDEIKNLFTSLGADIVALQFIGIFAVIVWATSTAIATFHHRSKWLYICLASLMVFIYFKQVFTPLLLFSIFFCILHSIPHYLKASREIGKSPKKPPVTFLINTVVAWIIVAAVSLFFYRSQNINSSTLNAIFSVLFALTIPHMLLVDLLLPKRLNNWKIS
ncbi:Brp/Blh family beta-carotene 15,15'-dioxygenase [Burkholderiales bacterium]|nr:Brp/Blh family beta-carotene 15,15'-dioxygenase [Burkholderiales bacterium]